MSAPSPIPEPSAAPPRTAPLNPPVSNAQVLLPTVPTQTLPPPDTLPDAQPSEELPRKRPRLQQPVRGRRLARPPATPASPLTPEQRLLVLDAWRRSGLPAGDFAPLVGVSKHTLYAWKRKFEMEGPAGLDDKPRGAPSGRRLPEPTRRAILMLKEANPDWGCERIAALLLRGPALPARGPPWCQRANSMENCVELPDLLMAINKVRIARATNLCHNQTAPGSSFDASSCSQISCGRFSFLVRCLHRGCFLARGCGRGV